MQGLAGEAQNFVDNRQNKRRLGRIAFAIRLILVISRPGRSRPFRAMANSCRQGFPSNKSFLPARGSGQGSARFRLHQRFRQTHHLVRHPVGLLLEPVAGRADSELRLELARFI